MWQIVLPAALPQILTGLQVALPIALIVAVVAEMAMGGYGLGGAMMTSSRFADSRGVFAGIVEIAIVGYCLVKAMAILRRRLLIWHQEAMEPSTMRIYTEDVMRASIFARNCTPRRSRRKGVSAGKRIALAGA